MQRGNIEGMLPHVHRSKDQSLLEKGQRHLVLLARMLSERGILQGQGQTPLEFVDLKRFSWKLLAAVTNGVFEHVREQLLGHGHRREQVVALHPADDCIEELGQAAAVIIALAVLPAKVVEHLSPESRGLVEIVRGPVEIPLLVQADAHGMIDVGLKVILVLREGAEERLAQEVQRRLVQGDRLGRVQDEKGALEARQHQGAVHVQLANQLPEREPRVRGEDSRDGEERLGLFPRHRE
mmetsp:Transcript_22359/g.48112  ORF Transcript_22359/g.48112 Transcript_22359/m.48112 type:complete len:238 (+) Transcript_22359:919-1632(+)